MLGIAVVSALPQAQQAPPRAAAASAERAQDQPFPPGSPFALLPGFKIERVTPADKTESYIVVTFDALGRPVVSQSSSGNGVSPRVLLDNNNDGIFETEKIVADQLNTCHGLFYASRTTLYADCRANLPGDPRARSGPRRWWRWWRRRTRRSASGRRCCASAAAQAPPRPGDTPPANPGISGLYKLAGHQRRRRDGHDRAHPRYTSAGMGDHGSHAIRRGPDGSVTFLIGNNTYVGAPPVNDDRGGQGGVAQLEQPEGAAVPAAVQRPAVRQQHAHRRARARSGACSPTTSSALFFSGMRNPYDFAYNLAGESVRLRQRHGMGRQLAVVPRGAHASHDSGRRRRAIATARASSRTSTSTRCRRCATCAADRPSASRRTRATRIRRGSSTTCSKPTGRAAGCSTRR